MPGPILERTTAGLLMAATLLFVALTVVEQAEARVAVKFVESRTDEPLEGTSAWKPEGIG
jgi:hypothetical protein